MSARDYSAFGEPVTKQEVAEFRRASKASGRFSSSSTTTIAIVVVIVGMLVVFPALSIAFTVVFSSISSISSDSEGTGSPVVIAIVMIAVVALVIGVIVAVGLSYLRRRWGRRLRQARFAEANGLHFSSGEAGPRYAGAIFGVGRSRQVDDHYYSTAGRSLDFGNYQYTTGSGKNRSTHRWGFLAMRLDRSLPHMVLDSTGNNGLFGGTNLPASFQRDQMLSLEGDFDDHFRLYCPSRYERDALYVFTPDLMALLIDNASEYDVEIVDDWLFVYSSGTFRMDDPRTLDQLLRIVDTVGAKTLSQTERYVDDRAMSRQEAGFHPGSAGVERPHDVARSSTDPRSSHPIAPGGRRLRRRFPVAIVVVIAGIVLFQIAQVAFDWF